MAQPTVIQGDLHVTGALSAQSFSAPASSITDAMIAPAANIAATKTEQEYTPQYSQPNTTATTETRTLHVVYGATGSIIAFRAGSIVPNLTTATVSVDLKKAGVSVLSAPIVLDNANTARVMEAATIVSAPLVAGDWLECAITASASGGTLATGVHVQLVVREAAQ